MVLFCILVINLTNEQQLFSLKKIHLARHRKRYQGKKEEKFAFRTNRDIRVPRIRLVGDNLEKIGNEIGETITSDIYPTRKVMEWADAVDLDLVEITPKADPPVCRIIDVKKFIYDRKKKEKELKAKTAKTVIKEIRFGPNTDDHDFDFKLRHAKKFLDEGAKVKAYVHFRGRSIVFKDRGELLLLKFLKELEEHGAAEALPRMEGRRMNVMISPKLKKKK